MKEHVDAQQLSELATAVLNLEAHWWQHRESKDAQMQKLGLTPVRYYQLLGRLIDTPAAYLHDPMLVNRLLRVRDHNRSRYLHAQAA